MGDPRSKPIPRLMTVVAGLCCALTGGACSFGPQTLERSHGRYNEAIRRVDEEQLLRNLVHIRYNETPLNLNVSSIAAQYELSGTAEAKPFFISPNPSNSNVIFRTFTSILPDLSLSGANRPTLTLIPADNSEAVKQYLTPIAPETLILLEQTSWPAATVLRLWVERVNGVPNAATASGPQRDFPPDFVRFRRATELLQQVQDLGLAVVVPVEQMVPIGGPLPASAITADSPVEAAKNGMEFRPNGDETAWSLVRKEKRLVLEVNPVALDHPLLDELAGLLNLRPGLRRYEIVVATGMAPDPAKAPIPPSDALQVNLRSTAQVNYYLSNGVEVPCEHLEAGLAKAPTNPDGSPFDTRAVTEGLFTVHSARGHKPPPNAFISVKYRDHWYYIDDRDQESKTTFALVLALSRLDFGRQPPGAPFLTLPVGR
ncbi:hypothetical protein [Paludisphaera rhizosphaerae]|uniref:hypothetical protein n=1 Tax=Paludisphaera rhizosphaerae TaxID=2711216 RepID=UPI001F0E0782|nr:hypothetical protein [Paludisphaera rhizosphaerae]